MASDTQTRILMVCTGNICRSPSAEGILRHMVRAQGLESRVAVDSAGTADWHHGEGPSRLAVIAAKARGYDLTDLRSRPLQAQDFYDFDIILGMDEGHIAHLTRAKPADSPAEIALFLDAWPDAGRGDVPDPYYGDETDYEYAIGLIESGCKGWIARLAGDA